MVSADAPTQAAEEPLLSEDESPPRPPTLAEQVCGCLTALICCPILLASLCCCCVTATTVSAVDTGVNKAQGKRWDGVQMKWVIDRLDDEEAQVRGLPKDDDDIIKASGDEKAVGDDTAESSPEGVKETEYYDALGVAADATDAKIKRAYYINARKFHPDKNPSEEAKLKFQAIGEAYQVLSDPKLRAVYDKQGKDGLSGDKTEIAVDSVDPSLIFTFLFGNDSFDDIVGRLTLVTQTLVGGMDGSSEAKITPQQMKELERRRIVRLAAALRDRIKSYMDGDEAGAKAAWTAEGERLVEVRYGEQILNAVGVTYKLVTTEIIGSWSEGLEAKNEAFNIKIDAATKAAMAQGEAAAGAEAGEDALPGMVGMFWNVTVIDITTTLREVVLKVCKDAGTTSDIRKRRAAAIQELGVMWAGLKMKGGVDGTQRSVRNLYASATAAAMEATIDKARSAEKETVV